MQQLEQELGFGAPKNVYTKHYQYSDVKPLMIAEEGD